MKKLFSFIMATVMLAMTYAVTQTVFGNEALSIAVTSGLGLFSAVMYVNPIVGSLFNIITIPDFTRKTVKERESMSDEDLEKYEIEAEKYYSAIRQKELQEALETAKDDEARKKFQADITAELDALNKSLLQIKNLSQKGGATVPKGLKEYIIENSEVLKKIKENKSLSGGSMEIVLKGTQTAADINSGSDYAMMIPGTIRKPVRATRIMDLFRRKKVSTEYIKYREENVVTRDAKFVVACATSTHTTKKTWIVRTVELAKIRDIVDACIDMLDDYDFVESEIKQLIEESIKLKADYELLLGASANPTDMLSIDSISSEFNASNVLAPFNGAFQDANLEQLVDAMGAQISVFGQENSWMADTVVMNFTDFVKYRNLKDANGNKLVLTLSDTVATIAGMRVVTSPIVPANELYVFDSTKGEILDRQMLTVKTSFENKDNIEHETVTFVAVERLQFHVANINQDAFMKCSDVDAAIIAITKPTT